MAGVTLSVTFNQARANELNRFLAKIPPSARDSFVRPSMNRAAEATVDRTREEIKRGRGLHAAPLNDRLTRRTGRLGDSIGADFTRSPKSVTVGTPVEYAAVHEQGFVGTQRVRAHTRTVAWGRKVPEFQVPAFDRSVNIRKRPYLVPAWEWVVSHKLSGIFQKQFDKIRPRR